MSFLSFVKSLGTQPPPLPGEPGHQSKRRPRHTTAAPTQARLFTLEEVAQHATESDCYTIVEGRVYDVTKYLRLHPGGFKLLYKNAGGDSTADFLALRHSAKSRVILEAYYVGDLAGTSQSTLSVPGGASSATAAPPRRVGAMVGPQPFLSVAPSVSSGRSVTGSGVQISQTKSSSSSSGVYPPPRSNTLHSSTSHPDRLSAYASFTAPPPLKSGGSSSTTGLSISISPPSSASEVYLPCPSRSPTTEALEHHLASHLSPTSDQRTPDDEEQSPSPPTPISVTVTTTSGARARPPVPRFADTTVAASSSNGASSSSASNGAASAASASSSSASSSSSLLGPRLFTLARRVQRTHDVQLLSFEPVFPQAAAAVAAVAPDASAAMTAAANSTDAVVVPSGQPSALDPAFWLHVPCGLHVSIGCTLADGSYAKRPYTPVSNQGGQFDLLVKTYHDGVVSAYLHAAVTGSRIEVWGPFGRFEYEEAVARHPRWTMIAQGTGIAPMYQLLRHVRGETTKRREVDGSAVSSSSTTSLESGLRLLTIQLLDCNRTESDILLRTELDQLERESDGQITIEHVLSKSSPSPSLHVHGRLNAPLLHSLVAPDPASLFLLCGSDEFHRDVTRWLKEAPIGAREEQIFCF